MSMPSGEAIGLEKKTISWNTHYLLTRVALGSMSDGFFMEEIPVRSLEDFVDAAGAALPQVMERYAALLAKKTGVSSAYDGRSPEIRSAPDLIAALRLNPHQTFRYCRVLRPQDCPPDAGHDPSRAGPPGGAYIEVPIGDRMSVLDVLCVYADEPDWGMDQEVFAVASYGLGEPPLGAAWGKTSQASFHMAFFHELPLVVRMVPRVEKTFLDARAMVFLALARLALDSRVDFWAWRFASWAAHYLQDLTQPYHAKLLPFPFWAMLGRFLRTPLPSRFAEKNKNLLMNRHILCEAIVHLWLNQAIKEHIRHPFVIALEGHGDCAKGTLKEVVSESAKIAADKAFRVNRALETILDDPVLDDPSYFVLSDSSYPLEQRLADAATHRAEALQEWSDLIGACLVQTGRVTRYMIREALL